MTNIFKIKKKLKKKIRALEKKIKDIEIAESFKKKRKLGPKSGENGKRKKKKAEKAVSIRLNSRLSKKILNR
jgi:hypothetical protein